MVFNKTEEQEKEYLRQIINTINDSINNTDKSVKEHVDTLQEYKEYLWSNKDIDPHEIRSMRESILRHFATGESVIDKRKRLGKILDIPYFGRIDFTEKKEGCETMALYIGIHTFYDPSQKANLIYDWRAPISSMFYDHELGNASYSSPSGEVDGDISLKRQYRIRKGKMEVARFGGRAPLGEQGFDPLHVLRRAACGGAFDNGRFQNFPYFVQFADIGATQPLLHEGIGRCGGCNECPCALPHVQESPVG